MKVCPACGAEYADDAAFCARDRTPLQAPESRAGLVGQIVGERYQVEGRLGEGGMGEVYRARHLLMGRRCALKVMAPALSTNPDALGRFNREATNASRIAHPNVCAVYDFGLTSDGLVFLAMELVEGDSLAELAAASGPMPVSGAVPIVRQVAAGLQAAHDLGIVHRDLKLDNIMVASGVDPRAVKLVDFGIAKAIEGVGDATQQRVTRTGFVVGTPEYMAPEQLAGDPLDCRTDQYALALVFYRLVTGQLPFDGGSAQDTMVQRLTTPPRPLAAALPETRFPDGLQAVLDTALARQPSDRYGTVTEFAQALEAALRDDAASTRVLHSAAVPPTRATAVRPRHRGAAIAGVVVMIGALASILSLQDRGSEPPAPETVDRAAVPAAGVGAGDTSAASDTGQDASASAAPPTRIVPVAAAVDTVLPDLADLEVPDRRRAIVQNELAIYRGVGMRVSSQRRARAAALLSSTYLEDGSRDPIRRSVLMDSARLFASRAWELNPTAEHRALLHALDTVPQ